MRGNDPSGPSDSASGLTSRFSGVVAVVAGSFLRDSACPDRPPVRWHWVAGALLLALAVAISAL
ncbi:hypothetical protein GCM10010185_37510 [Saccharothrix coeruleofusca]|uniref:Uncharacterized protein n=1 Tax=Saccharothrix coeruleofusca TaxID=33919 RepID=A0A918AN42_9PSEU|nr:hypothetical protein GCM10010185_37510 [Saccharothrix coeruleofusca]